MTNVMMPKKAAKTIVTFAKNPSSPFALPPNTASAPPEIEPPMPELLLDCNTIEAIKTMQMHASRTIKVVIKSAASFSAIFLYHTISHRKCKESRKICGSLRENKTLL